jgi:nucleoside-triphosphatase
MLIRDNWHPPVFIITGDPGEGKTSYLLKALAGLAEKDLTIRGIAAPGHFRDGIRSGFSLIDLATGEAEELCSTDQIPGSKQHGMFFFRPEGLAFGLKAISPEGFTDDTDLIVVDEVGIFELKGEIWAQSLDQIMGGFHPPMIWTVRRWLVDAIIKQWEIPRPYIIDITRISNQMYIGEFVEEIRIFRSIRRHKRVIPVTGKWFTEITGH